MKVVFTHKGEFEKTVRWLEERLNKDLPTFAMEAVGRKGVESLSLSTPIGPTGATARSWKYIVEKDRDRIKLAFVNNAHPEESVNVAVIKELGHGTGTGGYVAPRPYIKRAVDGVFETAGDEVVKDVLK